jgi:hypothetical protein
LTGYLSDGRVSTSANQGGESVNFTAGGKGLRAGLSAVFAAGVLALFLATSLPGWVGLAWAGIDGDISLNSFVNSSSCTGTNCATGSTGITNKGSGVGLYARADDGDGLEGFSLAGGGGVVGTANAGSGVEGYGGNGVYGEGSENGVQAKGGTFGVFAEGDDYGTYSRAPNYGVFGNATGDSGTGVWGESSSGTGVRANSATGTALHVTGKVKFSRSGTTTISAGTSSKAISLARVTTSSMVLATAQQSAGVYVKAAVPNNGSFTIRLTGNAPTGGLKVAYFVLN